MQNNKINESIGCSVDSCQYHNGQRNYCSLDSIQVGTHEANPKTVECTDCQSFRAKG